MKNIRYPRFETLKENWWIWELENGNQIRVKNIITLFQAYDLPDSDKTQLGFKMKTIVTLSNLKEKDFHKLPVPKSKIWKESDNKSLKKTEIDKFKVINNQYNYYEIFPDDDTTLLFAVQPNQVKIHKTNKYTKEGEPLYFVSSQQSITLTSMRGGIIEEIDVETEEIDENIPIDD